MKLKGCKTCNNFIFHSLVLCKRLGKNLLGLFNLNIYLSCWISLSTKSRSLSLDKGSLWVTMLKKVQTQRESTPQNFTEAINTLPMVKWLKLSSGDQFQNTENYKVAENEAHCIRLFSTLLPNERKPLPLSLNLYHTHKRIFILHMPSWFLPFYMF